MEGNIDERLDRVRELLKDPDFLEGNGLSNEVNIRMFCYEVKDEMRVRHFVQQILTDQTLPCRLKENNLYEIFLQCCEDKRILSRMADQEKKRGKDQLQKMIENPSPCRHMWTRSVARLRKREMSYS